jgi:glycosyltransferase involved in cell wall biosynthesis
LKIMLIHPHIFAGGAERAVVYLAHHLNSLGHEAEICTLSLEPENLPRVAEGIQYILPEKPLWPRRIEGLRSSIKSVTAEVEALRRLIKRHVGDFDILSPCNFPSYWSTYPFRNLKPIVWVSSEAFGPYNEARDIYDRSRTFRLATRAAALLDRHIVRRSVDSIITCSDYNRRLIMDRYGLEARVNPTGVDYEFFSNPKGAEDKPLPEGFILLQVGALVKRKNQLLSIRALKRVREKLPEAKLIIVGKGPWEENLKEEAKRLSLEEDIIFKGQVSEEELRNLYHNCDLNLYPVEEQTWGLVPFEALAAGRLSIVSESSGAGMIMKELGICYPINPSVEAIFKGVIEISKDPDRFREAIERGRKYIRENLTWEKYAERTVEIYEEASDHSSRI